MIHGGKHAFASSVLGVGILALVLAVGGCHKRTPATSEQSSTPIDSSNPNTPGPKQPSNETSDDPDRLTQPKLAPVKTVEINTKMERSENGTWRQKIPIPEGTSLVSMIAERMGAPGSDARMKLSVWGESEKLISLAEGTDALDSGSTTTLIGPYISDGETSLTVSIVNAPQNNSLFRIRELQIWRSKKEFEPLGTIDDGIDVSEADPRTQSLAQNLAILFFRGGSCSGFAISKSLLLTNHHCIGRLAENGGSSLCPNTKIVFRFFSDSASDPRVVAKCKSLVASDEALDYALIEFDTVNPGTSPAGLGVTAPQIANVPENLIVLQHPFGMPAQVSSCGGPPKPLDMAIPGEDKLKGAHAACQLDDSLFAPVSGKWTHSVITYSCDTQSGSSGSPVIQGESVVGLHSSSDLRYYQSDGSLVQNGDKRSCLERHLKLWNWGRNICDVLSDAARHANQTSIPLCTKASTK